MRCALRDELEEARRRERALMAVNIFDFATLHALATVAQERGQPIITQISAKVLRTFPPGLVAGWRGLSGNPRVYLHLDHCTDPGLIAACVEAGFDSVMFDGSALPLDENTDQSRELVSRVRRSGRGTLVETEIGHVIGVEDGHGGGTPRPRGTTAAEVAAFHRGVGSDLLAVGFGNMHGHYTGDEQFDLALLAEVHALFPNAFLVLHGGTGMDLRLVQGLVRCGFRKINISTELKTFWVKLQQRLAAEGLAPADHVAANCESLRGFFHSLLDRYAGCLL